MPVVNQIRTIDDAIPRGAAWQQCTQRPGQSAEQAHLCSAISVCGPREEIGVALLVERRAQHRRHGVGRRQQRAEQRIVDRVRIVEL